MTKKPDFNKFVAMQALAMGILAAILAIVWTYFEDYSKLFNQLSHPIIFSVFLTLIITFSYAFFRLVSSKIPIAYNVAIIGYPRSGKTTLMTSMFGEIFAKKVLDLKIEVKGNSTIEKVNSDLAKLAKGYALGPTKDQDLFAYRTNITKGKFFKKTYKVEFGDFPGEDSEEYANKNDKWLHNTNFFKWVLEADAFIFIIDTGKYLLNNAGQNDYVADMSAAIRASWQHILDTKDERADNIRGKPVLLVFNKADLLVRHEIDIAFISNSEDRIQKGIMKLGFDTVPPIIEIVDESVFSMKTKLVASDFSELINYLDAETNSFKLIFASSFSLINNKRVGINEILNSVIP